MPSYIPPVRGAEFKFPMNLVSQADTDVFKETVTLAAGDIQVSKDGGQYANLATFPPTEIDLASGADSGTLWVVLTAAEMTADIITVLFRDAAGAEWQSAQATINTSAQTLDTTDAAVDAVATTIGVAGAGLTAVPWNAAWDAEAQSEATDALNAYDPPTNAEMEARTILAAGYFDPAVDAVANVTAVGSVAGAVGSVAAGGITADSIAADAIDADALAATAIAKIQAGLALEATAQSILTDTGTTLDNLVDDLESRLTATRAAYLDNLAGGAVAMEATLAGQNDLLSAQVQAAAAAAITAANVATATDVTTVEAKVDSILADTGTDGVVVAPASKTGYALSDAGVDGVLDEVVKGTYTLRQMISLIAAAFGKVSGAGTTTLTFRHVDDSGDAMVAVVDSSGNRTSVTFTP